MFYFINTPGWLKKWYPNRIWELPAADKAIYLSFDDGPHPTITPYILDLLKNQNAKASFFCIGKNVAAYPEIYQRIIEEGHAVGNHSYNHLNGWKTTDVSYINDIVKAEAQISSNLFRPPYGRMKKSQQVKLEALPNHYKTIMWTILSGDFDKKINAQQCVLNVMKYARPGAIVVFHDSEKASARSIFALPKVLKQLSEQGYCFKKIEC